jgi:hypothetical protein
LDSLFDGILNKVVVPFIVKGLFSSDSGLDKEFKLVMAGFANIPVGYMEIVPVVDGLPDGLSAHITGKGLHIVLLLLPLLMTASPARGRKPITMVHFNYE